MKRYFGKFRRDVKALSPIFAVLILIAIAVIAGIIVYMFTSGYLASMMGQGTAGQEKVAVQAVEITSFTILTAYAVNTGGGADVAITGAILRDSSGNAIEELTGTATLAPGVLTGVACTYSSTLTAGETYTVALVSSKGNQFVSPSFKA